jgi:hypothetical protein
VIVAHPLSPPAPNLHQIRTKTHTKFRTQERAARRQDLPALAASATAGEKGRLVVFSALIIPHQN